MSPGTEPLTAEIDALREAVAEAGALVMGYFGQDPETWEKPGEGPVSEADLAANEVLHARLTGAFPAHGWLSEESADDPARLSCERVWIVDPIDGTRAFIAGKPEFTVCAALAVGGEAVAGAVFNPARDEFFLAIRGQGAMLNGTPLSAGPAAPFAEANILSTRGLLKPARWSAGAPPGGRHGYVNSIAYRVCKVATEHWDMTIAPGQFSEWDLAAAQVILEEAGGRVTTRTGAAIRYNAATPKIPGLIASVDPLHGELVAQFIPAEG